MPSSHSDTEQEHERKRWQRHLTLAGRYRITLTEALRDRSAYRELNAGPAVAA